MLDRYYNIVLIPDEQTAEIATDFAQSVYMQISYGYCLERGKVFPHITLAQFCTDEISVLKSVEEAVDLYQPYISQNISFSDFYTHPSVQDGVNITWLGLSTRLTPDLANIQAVAHGILEDRGLVPQNATLSEYWPHMTFARIRTETPLPSMSIPDYFMADKVGSWTLVVGRSDANWQFLG